MAPSEDAAAAPAGDPRGGDAAPAVGGETDAGPPQAAWSPLQKVLFRFACLYLPWYSLSFLKYYVSDFPDPEDPISQAWDRALVWIAEHVLRLPGELRVGPNGSGDTTADYLHVTIVFAGSALGCLVWTALDRRRPHYRRLAGWLHVACRYYLAAVLLTYGFAKVFVGQFPFPGLERLVQPYGESSPMGLVWTFMGYSRAYTAFTGLGEVAGGLLLLFRRTTTLGALVTAGVMANVTMINFAYDVPVKLFSSHLLLMALILVALDGRRVLAFLVLNRPAPAAPLRPHFAGPGARRAGYAVKAVVVAGLVVYNAHLGWKTEKQYGRTPDPPLRGLWEVETFVVDGESKPPLVTDGERWRYLVVDRPGWVTVRTMDGAATRYAFEVDEDARTASFATFADRETRYPWSYRRPTPETLVMEGELAGARLSVEMTRRDADDFLLVHRGFHWINEFPFNR